MKYLILLIALFIGSTAVAGPIFPSRSFILAPRFRVMSDSTKGVKFLRQQGIWGNLARAFGSEGDRSATGISLGGFIEFAQWENSSLSLLGDFEVLADSYNDISFNPRAIFWTEGVVYGLRFDQTELQAGYIHRCRHEIDNLDNNVVGTGESRNLIYGSLMARAVWRNIFVSPLYSHYDLWAQLDKYIITSDTRIPNNIPRGNTDIEHLDASFSAGAKAHLDFLGTDIVYARASFNASAYNSFKTTTIDSRLELGLEFTGEATGMNIFFGIENLHDDQNRPSPTDSKYTYIGFRFIGKNVGI